MADDLGMDPLEPSDAGVSSWLDLGGAWTLRAVDGPTPDAVAGQVLAAEVPGCVHLDLLRAAVTGDPFDGLGEQTTEWIGRTRWRYERSFDWRPDGGSRVALVAQGLDTLATVELNGAVVAVTENDHRRYRFDVTGLLRTGGNDVAVTFDAPVPALSRRSVQHGGELPHQLRHPFNALRKTACNFGWDWGIDVSTSGISRPIGIETWNGVRICAVRPLVSVAGTHGVLQVHVDLEHARAGDETEVEVTVRRGGVTSAARAVVGGSGRVDVIVPEVELWWPIGHGDQPLYDVEVAAGAARWTGRVGFRTVELDTSPDEDGTRFAVRVNDREVTVRGVNWVPADALAPRVTAERYAQRLDDAVQAGANLVRVWGGGTYESDVFYDLCDERGLLVWQDFAFACAAYAEEPWLADEVEAEVREAVTRLSPHPSLALWNGNNENLWGYVTWGWQTALRGRTWGDGYYRRLLPEVLAELDPTRPYMAGSPYSGVEYTDPNDENHGTVHVWNVWFGEGHDGYERWRPRFVSEFGFQGPPTWRTLTAVVHDEPLSVDGPQLQAHQKDDGGHDRLMARLAGYYPAPRDLEEWHLATSLNQAAAVRAGVEHFRSLAPRVTGTIWWQLNDDWPVVSWSLVDYYGRRKPAWFALRDAYAERLLTIRPRGDRTVVVVLNDRDEAVDATMSVRRVAFDGEVLAEASFPVVVAPRGSAVVAVPDTVAVPVDPSREVLVAAVDGAFGFRRAVRDYAHVVDQHLDPDPFSASVRTVPSGAEIVVTARSYVRQLTAFPDMIAGEVTVDRAVEPMLAGEELVIRLDADRAIRPDEVDLARVLRSANGLGRR
jgi:beta-mannosidase